MDSRIIKKEKHSRKDGELVELFSNKDIQGFNCVHSYFVSIKPGAIRGKHYHKNKTEIICPIYGKVEIILDDPKSGLRKIYSLTRNNSEYQLLLIRPGIAHAVRNPTQKEVGIVVFSNGFDLEDVKRYDFEEL